MWIVILVLCLRPWQPVELAKVLNDRRFFFFAMVSP